MSEEANNPKTTKVVVYDKETIENVLTILDKDTPVVSIATMKKIVEVFEILQSSGNVQDAYKNEDGDAISPEVYGNITEGEPMQDPAVDAPTFGNNEQVVFDAEDDHADIITEDDPADENRDSNGYLKTGLQTLADETLDTALAENDEMLCNAKPTETVVINTDCSD